MLISIRDMQLLKVDGEEVILALASFPGKENWTRRRGCQSGEDGGCGSGFFACSALGAGACRCRGWGQWGESLLLLGGRWMLLMEGKDR